MSPAEHYPSDDELGLVPDEYGSGYSPYEVEYGEHTILLPSEVDEGLLPAITAKDLDVIRRRDLVLQGKNALEDVLEVEVQIPHLLAIAEEPEQSAARLNARRALRCLHHIGSEDSLVIQTIGEVNVYHYVECVVLYGASRATYLALVEQFGLTAEQMTGLYALREQLADETKDKSSFPTIFRALQKVGMSARQAAEDPESAISAFTEAGFLRGYYGTRIYDHPIFKVTDERPWLSSRHIDTTWSSESLEWAQEYARSKRPELYDPDNQERGE